MVDIAGVPVGDLMVAPGETPAGNISLGGVNVGGALRPGGGTTQRRAPGVFEDLGRGIGTGIENTQAGLYGFMQLLGQLSGSETLVQHGREGTQRNLAEAALSPPTIGSFQDVGDVTDFFHYAAGGIGQAIPSIATSLAAGGIGGAIAKRALASSIRQAVVAGARATMSAEAPTLAMPEINAAVRAMLREPSVNRMLTSAMLKGGALGAAASEIPTESGGVVHDLDQAGLEAPITALLAGTLNAGLDAAPNVRLLSRLFPGMDRELSKGFVKDMLVGLGKQSLLEGGTEGLQEMISMTALAYHDPTFDPLAPENLMRAADAAAIGALAGVVTGAAGEATNRVVTSPRDTINHVRAGGQRLRSYLSRSVADGLFKEAPSSEADATVPGFVDTVASVGGRIGEMATSAASTLRSKAAEGVDTVLGAMRGAPNESIGRAVSAAEETLRGRLAPEMDRLMGRTRDALSKVREQARGLADGPRAQFLREQADRIVAQAEAFIRERFTKASDAVENETTEKFETQNLPDEEEFGYEDTADDGTVLRAFDEPDYEPRHTIGQTVRQRFRVSPSEMSDPVAVRSRGEDAVPFKSRVAAEKAADEVRQSFPNVSESAVQVVERPDGFVVGIFDATSAEEIFTQQRTNDTLTKSAALARSKDVRSNPRVIEVRRPGSTATTRLDLPTIAYGGEDVVERSGGTMDENGAKRALKGMDAMIAHMLDQGFELPGGMEALADKHVLPGLTVAQARALASRDVEHELHEAAVDPNAREFGTGPTGLLQGILRELGDRDAELQIQTPEEQNRQTEDEQAHAAARARTSPATKTEFTTSPSNKKVRVGLLSSDKEFRDRVAKLVSDVVTSVGMGDQEFLIVDRKGLEKLLESDQFTSQEKGAFLNTIAKDENGKIAGNVTHGGTLGKRRIIFLSKRVVGNSRAMLRVLFHELGHVVQRVHYDKLPRQLAEQMRQEYRDLHSPLDFDEWMADQFVAWAVRNEAPKNAVQRFFAKINAVLFKMFNEFQQLFSLSGTYNDFMRGVVGVQSAQGDLNEWGEAILRQHFQDQGRAAYPGKILTDINTQNLTLQQMRQQGRAQWAQIIQRMNQTYPRAMRVANTVFNTAQKINDSWFASLNGALRRQGVPEFDRLADMFNKTPGQTLEKQSYFVQLQRQRAEFFHKAHTILKGKTDAEKASAIAELTRLNGRPGTHTDPIAMQLRGLLDQMLAYMQSKGLVFDAVENYFPKIWDAEKVKAGEQQIRTALAAKNIDPASADKIFDHMLTHDGSEADFQSFVQPVHGLSGVPSANFIRARGFVLTDPTFDQFLSQDIDRLMERYINAAVKRAEFNDRLGDTLADAKAQKRPWNPKEKLEVLLSDAALKSKASADQVQFARNSVDALLGRYGRNTPDGARRAMAWIATYQNLRVLGLSQLSSLPDLIGPAIRTSDYGEAFNTLRARMKEITDKQSDLNEAARVWGIISDSMNQHVLTEHYDTHWFPERARRINDAFFRAIGMEKLNNFVRSYALAVGQDFIERRANAAFTDPAAARDLAELGLSKEDVASWVANGRQTYGANTYASHPGTASDQKVADALVQFVNEANMRPNPSQRPLMASHPALMLVWHLKSFMFAFYDVFVRQVMLNAERAGVPWQKAWAVALPAMLMMAMTAAGLELRELIQYKIWGNAGRTERMTGSEYFWELTQRSGLMGPSQLVVDWENSKERGNAGIVAIAGPTLQQLNELVNSPPSTSLPKAVPVAAQIPQLRDWLRGDF